jgi:L-aminopeptidase/D-esterase-like protein
VSDVAGGQDTPNGTLTDVPGVKVGHAQVPGGGSGCTVVLGPFRGVVEVLGSATGSREFDALDPRHVVPRVDAVVLTGGSAYGLAAADGVAQWLEARGGGYRTRMGPVPIVPAAVLYDLAAGRGRPGPEEGRQACEDASSGAVRTGQVGAGTGATVGKLWGLARARAGGIGSSSVRSGRWTVGALAAVNALGDVYGFDEEVVPGPRVGVGAMPEEELGGVEQEEWHGEGGGGEGGDPLTGRSTSLAVVATDAPLSQVDLGRLVRMANTAVARRIRPSHTPFDGDVTFAVSTADEIAEVSGREILELGIAAAAALERAIVSAAGGGAPS